MSEELRKDIVDGKIVDWQKLEVSELEKMKEKLQEKEKEILAKIDEELEK